MEARTDDVPYQPDGIPDEPRDLVAAALGGDWPRAVALLKANWISLLCDHYDAFSWLYTVLPAEVVEADPMVRAGRDLRVSAPAAGLVPRGRLPDSEEELEALGRSPRAGELLGVATAHVILLRRAAMYHAAAELSAKAGRIAQAAGREQAVGLVGMLAVGRAQWGISHQLVGDAAQAARDLRQAYQGLTRDRNKVLAGCAAGAVALSEAMAGNTVEASRWLERAAELPEANQGWLAEVGHVPASVARAVVALDRLDLPGAAHALERIRTIHGGDEYWAFVAWARAGYELLDGLATEAVHHVEEAKAGWGHKMGDGVAGPLLAALSAEGWLTAGQGNRALAALAGADQSFPAVKVALARLQLLSGHPDAALVTVTEQLWRPDVTPRARMELLLLQAAAAHDLDQRDEAVGAFERATTVATHYRLLRPFTTVSRSLVETLSRWVPAAAVLFTEPPLAMTTSLYPAAVQVVELTGREQVVLEAMVTEMTWQQIAQQLVVSVATVKSQRHSLYKKLGVHNRRQALVRAHEWGLIPTDGARRS